MQVANDSVICGYLGDLKVTLVFTNRVMPINAIA